MFAGLSVLPNRWSFLSKLYQVLKQHFFFLILQIYKDWQFDNTKIKNSKIQVQSKTQTLRKSYTFLNKVCTRRGHINIMIIIIIKFDYFDLCVTYLLYYNEVYLMNALFFQLILSTTCVTRTPSLKLFGTNLDCFCSIWPIYPG